MEAVAGTMLTHSFVSVGETVACLYANGNYPAKRGEMMWQKKEDRINGAMSLSRS